MELIAQAATAATPYARRLLDIGCGAGNYSLKLVEHFRRLDPTPLAITLVDLSRPMLMRAEERLRAAGITEIVTHQADIRELTLGESAYDVIVAAAVLHHLRTDAEWNSVFAACFRALAPGGSLWIFDLVTGSTTELHAIAWRQYGEYLVALNGVAHRDKVFAYVEQEDTPRPLVEQLERLRSVGFHDLEVLHKHGPFAAFGAVKR